MPLPAKQLSRWFDRHRRSWEHLWNRRVDLGQMSEQTLHLYEQHADDIGAMLHQLAENHARLELNADRDKGPPPPGESAPLIFLRPEAIDDL